jgi:hypothetical protein
LINSSQLRAGDDAFEAFQNAARLREKLPELFVILINSPVLRFQNALRPSSSFRMVEESPTPVARFVAPANSRETIQKRFGRLNQRNQIPPDSLESLQWRYSSIHLHPLAPAGAKGLGSSCNLDR